jgi:parallel beta-helix repeat protein
MLSVMACDSVSEVTEKPELPDFEPDPMDTQAPSVSQVSNQTTSGRMMEDEIWQGEILITGDVEVPAGVTLTIEPGTVIRFTPERDDQHSPDEYSPSEPETLHTTIISIILFGTLEARGAPDQPITFTSDSDVPGDMDWQSIMFEEGGEAILEYVVIEHGYFGLQLNSPSAEVHVTNSTFRDITTCCICTGRYPLGETIIIRDNLFQKCGREAVDTYPSHTFEVSHNIFTENHVGVVSLGSSVKIMNNLFIQNGRGVGVYVGGTPEIIGNEFTENDGAAIHIADASPTISNNNIYGNIFSIQIEEFGNDLNAENNWWGSTDVRAIEASIQDGKDQPSLVGIIDFEPYATEKLNLDVPRLE